MIDLNKLIPEIKRARDYRLYGCTGRRYIDCYQNNGHALLGHRAEKLSRTLKNTLSKGLLYDFPSVYEKRLIRLLITIFPAYSTFRIRRSFERVLKDISLLSGGSITAEDITDPVLISAGGPDDKSYKAAYWRPFTDSTFYKKYKMLVPLFPFAAGGSPAVLCFKDSKDKAADVLPASDTVSPVLLAGVIHVMYRLKHYKIPDWVDLSLPKSFNIWKREGIYLKAECSISEYENVFKKFLAEGVIISPCFPGPTIMPGGLSDGERKKIIGLLKVINGK
ncbi:MAG: hypothetical protein GXP33_11965 [Spirochaetes bacterium]|nr:hypothetical protein [Spirochaetota bacterium]